MPIFDAATMLPLTDSTRLFSSLITIYAIFTLLELFQRRRESLDTPLQVYLASTTLINRALLPPRHA